MDKMLNFFNDLKKEITPKLSDAWNHVQKYLSTVFQDIDAKLLKILNLLQKKHIELKKYMAVREKIKKELEQKEQEIERLESDLRAYRESQYKEEYEGLHQSLTQKLDELLSIQNKYRDIEDKIESHLEEIDQLKEDKRAVEEERKDLRKKYDEVNVEYSHNKKELKRLNEEIESLKEKELVYRKQYETKSALTEEELIKVNQELTVLRTDLTNKQEEKEKIEQGHVQLEIAKKKLEQELMAKVSDIQQLNNSLQKELQEKERSLMEKTQLNRNLEQKEQQLKEQNQLLSQQQENIKLNNAKLRHVEAKVRSAQNEKKALEGRLLTQEKDFLDVMDDYEKRMTRLNDELIEKQNENTMLAYEYGQDKGLTEQERKILEREYEPRFQRMYPEMDFQPQFFGDFLQLTVADRIKAELVIAQLHYQYHIVQSKIRPNTIRTKNGAIMEFPFSKKGRIYFRNQSNVKSIYQLSKTEKDQEGIILWLQKFQA